MADSILFGELFEFCTGDACAIICYQSGLQVIHGLKRWRSNAQYVAAEVAVETTLHFEYASMRTKYILPNRDPA